MSDIQVVQASIQGAQPTSEAQDQQKTIKVSRQFTRHHPSTISYCARKPLPELDRDTTTGWEILLASMRENDRVMIDEWISSMNNLLIFAGLFSAVVTAFIIESYSWLQPDPADTSNLLLMQISLQLSSFSVNPAFINSTALSAADGLPPFQPSSLSVRINVLWIVSLAISLIAALFAILVQQWLAKYPVRRSTSVREGVRMRQLRYDALHGWGVADIVALLPVLLQVALILFLAGLIMLLWSLNSVVACAVTVVVAVPVAFFASTAILPLISTSCPYKSTITTILFTCGLLTQAIVTHALFALALVGVIPTLLLLFCADKCGYGGRAQILAEKVALLALNRTFRAASALRTRLSSRVTWTDRDFEAAQKRVSELDFAAVLWSPHALTSGSDSQFDGCLLDLSAPHRAVCALTWAIAAFNLNINDTELFSRTIDPILLDHRLKAQLDPKLVTRLRVLLLDSLPRWDLSYVGLRNTTCMLALLRHLVKLDPPPDAAYMEKYCTTLIDTLIAVSQCAVSTPRATDRVRTAARSVVDCWVVHGVPVSHFEMPHFNSWALHILDALLAELNQDDQTRYDFEEHDSFLSLTTLAFLLHQHHPASTADTLRPLVENLRTFVRVQAPCIADFAAISLDSGRTDGAVTAMWPTLITSLRALAGLDPPRRLAADAAVPLVDQMLETFERQDGVYFQSLLPPLREIRNLCSAIADECGVDPSANTSKVEGALSRPLLNVEQHTGHEVQLTGNPQDLTERGDVLDPDKLDDLHATAVVPELDREGRSTHAPSPSPSPPQEPLAHASEQNDSLRASSSQASQGRPPSR